MYPTWFYQHIQFQIKICEIAVLFETYLSVSILLLWLGFAWPFMWFEKSIKILAGYLDQVNILQILFEKKHANDHK